MTRYFFNFFFFFVEIIQLITRFYFSSGLVAADDSVVYETKLGFIFQRNHHGSTSCQIIFPAEGPKNKHHSLMIGMVKKASPGWAALESFSFAIIIGDNKQQKAK